MIACGVFIVSFIIYSIILVINYYESSYEDKWYKKHYRNQELYYTNLVEKVGVKEAFDDLKESIQLYDLNRHIGHIPRVELVAGDALKTIPEYIQDNPHLVVGLLYLDFDLYEPTKVAIEQFLPRMPKGSIIVFDQLNHSSWPGETQAVLDTIGLRNLRIERFTYTPHISYAVLE